MWFDYCTVGKKQEEEEEELDRPSVRPSPSHTISAIGASPSGIYQFKQMYGRKAKKKRPRGREGEER